MWCVLDAVVQGLGSLPLQGECLLSNNEVNAACGFYLLKATKQCRQLKNHHGGAYQDFPPLQYKMKNSLEKADWRGTNPLFPILLYASWRRDALSPDAVWLTHLSWRRIPSPLPFGIRLGMWLMICSWWAGPGRGAVRLCPLSVEAGDDMPCELSVGIAKILLPVFFAVVLEYAAKLTGG